MANVVIDNAFRQYMQIKKAKEDIENSYEISKATIIELLNTMEEYTLDGNTFTKQTIERTTVDDAKFSQWLLKNEKKNLLNIVFKPNMDLIDGVYADSIPSDIRNQYIKQTQYDKIIIKKGKKEESE